MKNWIIAALVAVIATGGALGALAATQDAGRVFEVRVWQSVDEPAQNYVSIREEGGDWRAAGTRPVTLTQATPNGRYRYGDLTVTLRPRSDAPALGTAESSGHWSISRVQDPIDDSETVVATLSTEAVIEKVWTGADIERPYAQIYCNDEGLHALVYWNKSIFGPLTPSELPLIRSVWAVWRVDGGEPVSHRWLLSMYSQATFAQYPSEFVSAILGKDTLIMRVVPSNGEDHTLTLDITGLADVLGNLPCYPR